MSDLRFIYRLITRSIYELLALTNELIDITVIKSVPPREDIKLKICLSVLLIGDLAIYTPAMTLYQHMYLVSGHAIIAIYTLRFSYYVLYFFITRSFNDHFLIRLVFSQFVYYQCFLVQKQSRTTSHFLVFR